MENGLKRRTQLLDTLLEVSNLVSSTLDMRPLLESILDQLKKILDYSGAKLFFIEGDMLYLKAHRSPLNTEKEANYSCRYNNFPLGQEIVLNKKTVVIPDIYDDTPASRLFKETLGVYLDSSLSYVRSWVGIPLIVKDRVIGVLTIDHSQPGFYLSEHIELGMAFANQAAIEFENARLYSETIKRTDQLKTMLTVQQAITKRLDLDSVLKLIAEEARRLTKSSSTAVFLVEGGELVFSIYSGGDNSKLMGYRVSIENSIIGCNLLMGKSVILNSREEYRKNHKDFLENADIETYISIPLMVNSKPIGIIAAINKLEGCFNTEDENVLSIFATSAVIGLENARLYQEERRRHLEDEQRRRVAEGLRDMLFILNSNRPLEEMLQYIVKEASRLMGTDTGALYQLEDEGVSFSMKAFSGLPKELVKNMEKIVGSSDIYQSIIKRKPVIITDIPELVHKLNNYIPECKQHLRWITTFCSELIIIPLVCKDEIYGCIILYIKEKRIFNAEELDLIANFAYQAALAIDNARLREKAEVAAVSAERNRLARDLHDAVTQTLFSSSLIAEVLPKIWKRNQEEGMKRLDELKQLNRGALAEMRTLLLELRPATLVDVPLPDLLKHLAEATFGRARIPVELELDINIDIPIEVKMGFYRITQEALNNIAKHSGATKAYVSVKSQSGITVKKDALQLLISDNGKGFDKTGVGGNHLGLGIMGERAEAIGAVFSINSIIGKGTDILISWEAG